MEMARREVIDEALRRGEDITRRLMVRVSEDGADLVDVGAAAAAIHTVGKIRREHGPLDPSHVRIERERLADLSRRLVELDDGDVAAAAATAILITGKPVKVD